MSPNLQDLRSVQIGDTKPPKRLDFVSYIDKHVKVDIMLDKFIKHYFIDLRVFPFEAKDIFGAEPAKANVFMVWEHYYKKAL
mmetsp:Transcript_5159/g.4374  ORF Transcript_5159/g.4374 Transcript_5159/m.4374 type:complete len:82 (+) Transcript_5159:253-498(+)